jgi:hypothetical protein
VFVWKAWLSRKHQLVSAPARTVKHGEFAILQTQPPKHPGPNPQPRRLETGLSDANLAFTVLFCCEMLTKMLGLGLWGYLSDLWNVFDCIVVSVRWGFKGFTWRMCWGHAFHQIVSGFLVEFSWTYHVLTPPPCVARSLLELGLSSGAALSALR